MSTQANGQLGPVLPVTGSKVWLQHLNSRILSTWFAGCLGFVSYAKRPWCPRSEPARTAGHPTLWNHINSSSRPLPLRDGRHLSLRVRHPEKARLIRAFIKPRIGSLSGPKPQLELLILF